MVFLEDQIVEDIKVGDDPQSSPNGLIDLNQVPSLRYMVTGKVCKKMMAAMLVMKLLYSMLVIMKWESKLLMSHKVHHKFGNLLESGNL